MSFDFVHAEFETWAGSYDADALGRTHYRAHERVAQAVRGYVFPRPSLKIVDLGIGTGLTAGLLRDHFRQAHITGCDFSAAMLRECAAKEIADELIECDLRDHAWPLPARAANIVTCAGVLEFLHDTDAFMANLHMVMKPGAVAALTYEVKTIAGKIGSVATGAEAVKRQPEDMEHAAQAAGFAILEQDLFQGYAYYGRAVTYGLQALRR